MENSIKVVGGVSGEPILCYFLLLKKCKLKTLKSALKSFLNKLIFF